MDFGDPGRDQGGALEGVAVGPACSVRRRTSRWKLPPSLSSWPPRSPASNPCTGTSSRRTEWFAYVPKRSLQPEFIERKMTIPEPRLLSPPVAEPVTAQAEVRPSKPVQLLPVQTPAASQPSKTTVKGLVAKPEPELPLFAESAPEASEQPEPRKSAFKKQKEGAAREWKPLD